MSTLLSVLLLAAGTQAAQPQAPAVAPGETIVVTGQRIADYHARLRACIARNCPPDEEIGAALALAELQFVDGDYRHARGTVMASIRRNGRHARAHPEAVADLHYARALMAQHLGEDGDVLHARLAVLETLQEGLPVEDHRHFGARLDLANLYMAQRRPALAFDHLREVRERASAAGLHDISAIAQLRGLYFQYLDSPRGDAKQQLADMSRGIGHDRNFLSTGAAIMLARIHRREGNIEESNRLLAAAGRGHRGSRSLIYTPPIDLQRRDPSALAVPNELLRANVISRRGQSHEGTWVDVGFLVMGNGRVEEVEIVRDGGSTGWTAPLIESIRGRVYSASPDNSPTYRLERYTYTAPWEVVTGSRMRNRSPEVRLEYLDLTGNETLPPPPS